MTKKISNEKELLQALLDGHKVETNQAKAELVLDGLDVVFKSTGKRLLTGAYIFPCTIVEEHEYLYEWEWFICDDFEEYNTKLRLAKRQPSKNAVKTGRKFILKDGVPMLVED